MIRFALKNMLIRKTKLLMVLLSVVLSAGVALIAYNISMQVHNGIINTAAYYDLLIGPSGSSTQLAMNTMFFTDSPLGTISYEYVEELQKNPQVNEVVPVTMGDSYNAAKIVGTTSSLLKGKTLAEGTMFAKTYECVLGAAVAENYQLKVGDALITSHGLSGSGSEHAANPLTVAGILETTHTAYDNVIFTGYETVWAVHSHEEEEEAETEEEHQHAEGEVCAILVKTKNPSAYYQVSEYYKKNASLLVINPSTVLREVLENVDLSSQIVYVLCGVILVMNILVITVITLLNMVDMKQEIRFMRLIGIRMAKIQTLYLLQNAILGGISTLLALLFSMLGLRLCGGFVADMGIVLNAARIYPMEFAIMALVFAVSVLPTVVCAQNMARKNGLEG